MYYLTRSWFVTSSLRLRNVYRLADHHAAVQDKHQSDRMELEDRTLSNQTERNVLVSPAFGNPVRHKTDNSQSSWDRGTLEVFGLSAFILRENSDRDVEPSKAGETAENKESEENVIDRGADTERKGSSSGGEAEGNLSRYIIWLAAG
jgi:hypothetical protein